MVHTTLLKLKVTLSFALMRKILPRLQPKLKNESALFLFLECQRNRIEYNRFEQHSHSKSSHQTKTTD